MTAAPAKPALATRFRVFARRNRALVWSSGLLLLIVLLVILGPFALPSPDTTDPVNQLHGPSGAHLLGTDFYGRDLLSRLVTGGRASLGLSVLVTLCAVTLGSLIGLISGYFRIADQILMRVMDAWMAFPALVLAMSLAIALGPGITTELIALTVIFTPFTARVIRAMVLSLSKRAYIDAARASGMGSWKILRVHVLPHVLPLAQVQVVILSAAALLVDAAMSFLGLGISPPTPTWGNIIAEGRTYMTSTPLLIIAPGFAIVVSVLLLNIVGGNLRAIIDPRSRTLMDLQRARARTLRAPEPKPTTPAAEVAAP